MKNKAFLVVAFAAFDVAVMAQSVSTGTNEFEVDFENPGKLIHTAVPAIRWIAPNAEVSYVHESTSKISLVVECSRPVVRVTFNLRQTEQGPIVGTTSVVPEHGQELKLAVEKTLTLFNGDNLLEVVAENIDGQKTFSHRKIHIGASSVAAGSSLDRTDYAVIFATDQYDNWSHLVNPVFDSRTIAEQLMKTYGYKTEVVENATQAEVLRKLREYAEKKYKPLDQLFIFFAGHGTFDQVFGEGFVVTRESQVNDEGKTSYLSHNRLRSIVNNIPCDHIFLAMDVCFGGTFDATLASARGDEAEVYKEQTVGEFITRKLALKTRRYLTSGGKTYVSDGIPGKHSPFAKAFLEALRSRGGRDGVLTVPEILSYVEGLKVPPKFGEFGDNAPGSDFLFVVR